jgi:hypothetical protein
MVLSGGQYHPIIVEGLSFLPCEKGEGERFDKLSPNGLFSRPYDEP